MNENKLVVFQNKEIRRTLHNNEWWFSITDVIGVLQQVLRLRIRWFADIVPIGLLCSIKWTETAIVPEIRKFYVFPLCCCWLDSVVCG